MEHYVQIDEKKELRDLEKYANYYFLLHFWMKFLEEGKKLEFFFRKRGYEKIAIYGMGDLGGHILSQLPDDLMPVFTIDRGIIRYNGEVFPMELREKYNLNVDVVVITPLCDYEIIKELVKANFKHTDVVSLEEVILSI